MSVQMCITLSRPIGIWACLSHAPLNGAKQRKKMNGMMFYGFDVDYEESRDHFPSQRAEYINGERHVLEDIEQTDCKDDIYGALLNMWAI